MKKKLAIAIIGKEGGGLRVGAVVSGELVFASKTVGRDDPNAPQPVPATVEYAYQYDNIGNRISSTEQSPGGPRRVRYAKTSLVELSW